MGSLTDAHVELRQRKRECEANGADDDPLAANSAERKRERGKDNEGRNNMSNSDVVRDKGDDERESIDGNVKTKNQAKSLKSR